MVLLPSDKSHPGSQSIPQLHLVQAKVTNAPVSVFMHKQSSPNKRTSSVFTILKICPQLRSVKAIRLLRLAVKIISIKSSFQPIGVLSPLPYIIIIAHFCAFVKGFCKKFLRLLPLNKLLSLQYFSPCRLSAD